MILKVCGLNNVENIQAVEGLKGVTHSGFIFVQSSPRNAFSVSNVPKKKEGVKRVGVFMNPVIQDVRVCVEKFQLDIVQLHGDETPELCAQIRQFTEVWKAIGIVSVEDLLNLERYAFCCSAFVFDKKTPMGGGSGERYNWQLLSSYTLDTPFLLSGGIDGADADRIAGFKHDRCAGYDINSRFEVSPGIKDTAAINSFIEQLK